MFGFIKGIFSIGSLFLSSLVSTTPSSCISMIHQACKVRPEIVNVNSNGPIFYPFSIKTSKCSGSCNNINDSYAKVGVPDTVKKLSVKVFNLMSRANETRHIKWHETSKCECKLDARYNVGMMINVDAHVKNWLIKVYVIKDMLGILVIVNENVINHVMLASIWSMKIVNVGKGW